MYRYYNYIIKCTLSFLMICSFSQAHPRLDMSWVESWAYQLQDIDVNELHNSTYDLLVIDYSKDGSDEQAFSKQEINIARKHGSKIVLAYLSIGEAEDYRFYWQSNWRSGQPGFVGPENPYWEGNYKAKYWKRSWWRQVVRPYLNKIIKAGFNGVYLDIVDAYWYWGQKHGNTQKRAKQMYLLIKKIQRHANRKTGGHFAICPQNALSIIDDLPERFKQPYINMIDCVGVESLFYNIWSKEDQTYRFSLLKRINQAHKPILNVEYITPSKHLLYENQWLYHPLNFVGYPSNPDQSLSELTEL